MNNPTDEQIKEFWEWCGVKYKPDQDVFRVTLPDGESYNFGADWKMDEIEPPIDLNNLFKYAVPKLKETHAIQMRNYVDTNTWEVETIGAMIGYNSSLVKDEDPALALFWAIWEAIKGTK